MSSPPHLISAAGPLEILPGVFRWSADSPAHQVELASHAIRESRRLVIFDPIRLVQGLDLPGGGVILLTNENHLRDAAAWRRNFGFPVWCAPEAVVDLPDLLRWGADGDPAPDWIRISLPGGPAGETAFYHPERSLVVFGDAVVHLAARGLEILPDKYCADPARLRESLKALPRFNHALFAHGDPLLGNASDAIAALR